MRAIIQKRPGHIVTIEDPIEFLFADGKAAVSQREVSTDSPSFNEALKNMFRQDPDVIMVGEMRDWNTMQTAITAAETGHLVFSTLHTNSAAQSIDRIIDSCPQEQQAQVRSQLSIVLRAIVSMNLIETSDGSGRCAVVEVMINSPKIEKHILNGEVKEIHEEIENSVNYYKMQSMNQCLIALLVNRRITYAKAMELSTDPEDLSLKLRKLFPQIEENQRGGLMASDNDFSQITQLIEIKRLYEEQEEKWKLRLSEKDEELTKYMSELRDQRRVIEGRDQVLNDAESENARLKSDAERISREFQQKIGQLNERIKELNQRLVLAEGGHELEPVHVRHVHVHDEHVRRSLQHGFARDDAVFSRANVVARAAQMDGQQLAHVGVVVDDQDVLRLPHGLAPMLGQDEDEVADR